jgi:hypothetical protein
MKGEIQMCELHRTPEQEELSDFLWSKIEQFGSVEKWIRYDQSLPKDQQEIKSLLVEKTMPFGSPFVPLMPTAVKQLLDAQAKIMSH